MAARGWRFPPKIAYFWACPHTAVFPEAQKIILKSKSCDVNFSKACNMEGVPYQSPQTLGRKYPGFSANIKLVF
uniref:Uncharacterized protein n=1 Tax=Anguilla anguilla TaxID=7936 RepID=A0A0E9PB06_ANGAN